MKTGRGWRPPVWWAEVAAAGYPRAVLTPEEDGVDIAIVIEGERSWRRLACFAPSAVWADIASRVLDDTPASRAAFDRYYFRLIRGGGRTG
jgi:hypothetical protein